TTAEYLGLDNRRIMAVPLRQERQPVLDLLDLPPVDGWVTGQHAYVPAGTVCLTHGRQQLGIDGVFPGVDGRLRRIPPDPVEPLDRNAFAVDVCIQHVLVEGIAELDHQVVSGELRVGDQLADEFVLRGGPMDLAKSDESML